MTLREWVNEDKDLRGYLLDQWDYIENEKENLTPDNITKSAKIKAHWKCNVCGYKWYVGIAGRCEQLQRCPDCSGRIHHSIVGQKYGKLTVIEELDKYKKEKDGRTKRRMVLCVCECGNEIETTEHQLKGGKTRSCGCMLREPHNYVDRKWYIYMHRNTINGKRYIGKTMQMPEERWRNGNGYKKYRYAPLYEDIIKYGWDKFEHVILEECMDKKYAADRERYYIRLYDTMNSEKGYNQNEGGDSSYGYKHCEEVISNLQDKMSESVTQYTLDGKRIKIYKSMSEAADLFKVSVTSISNCVNKRTQECAGYIWRRIDIDELPLEEMPKQIHNASKAVLQFDSNHNLIKRYDSVKDAALQNKMHTSSISSLIKNKRCSKYGFIFEYEKHTVGKNKVVVQIDKNGDLIREYSSVKEAEMITGISAKSISGAANGKTNTAGGYVWKYKCDINDNARRDM